jgi:hypothetical protein
MSIGPVEYMMIGFPGNKFRGDILPELVALVQSGTVRILDLVFISKDDEGEFLVLEADEDEAFAVFGEVDGDIGGFIGDEDIAYAVESLEPNSSVLLLMWEDLWAGPLADAIRAADGIILEGARIPHDLVAAAEAAVLAADAG